MRMVPAAECKTAPRASRSSAAIPTITRKYRSRTPSFVQSLSGREPQGGGAQTSSYFESCEPVHAGFLRTSLQGVGTFQGNSKCPIRAVGQGDSYGQPIPFAARHPALPASCNSDPGFNCGFTILLCCFRANLSDQRCLGRDGPTFSGVQNRSVLDAQKIGR